MKQAASARNIAGARADNTARISSIRRQGGDGVGARRAEPELEEGWRVRVAPPRDTRVAPIGSTQEAASERVRVAPLGRVRVAPWEPGPPYRTCTRTTTEECHGTRPDEHNT